MSAQKEKFVGFEGLPGVGKTTLIWQLFDPDTAPREYLPNGAGKHIAVVGEARDFAQDIPVPDTKFPAFYDQKETLAWNEYFLEVERLRRVVALENAKSGLPVVFDRTSYSMLFIRTAIQLLDESLYAEFDHVVSLFSDALHNDEIILPSQMVLVTAGRELVSQRLAARGTSSAHFSDPRFLDHLVSFYDLFAEVYNQQDNTGITLVSQQGQQSLEQQSLQFQSFMKQSEVVPVEPLAAWESVLQRLEATIQVNTI